MILALRRRHRWLIALVCAAMAIGAAWAATHGAADPLMDTLPPALIAR